MIHETFQPLHECLHYLWEEALSLSVPWLPDFFILNVIAGKRNPLWCLQQAQKQISFCNWKLVLLFKSPPHPQQSVSSCALCKIIVSGESETSGRSRYSPRNYKSWKMPIRPLDPVDSLLNAGIQIEAMLTFGCQGSI